MDISVIIPAYNAEKYIDKCLDRLLNQTFKGKYEIIIVNDGSKDNTLKILKKYAKENSNINLITQKNSGQAVARNKAIDVAKGKYIMFVDIDDFVSYDMLKKLYDEAKSSKADLVYCDYYEYYSEKKLKPYKNYFTDDTKKNAVLINFAPWAKLYKTDFFKSCNLKFLEGKLFEDITIIPIINALAKNPRYIAEPLYYYNCSNVSSIRLKKYNKKLEDIFDSIDNTYNNFLTKNLLGQYYDEIEFIYLYSFLNGSVFRFSDFKEGLENAKNVRIKIKKMFPNMLKNKYYKEMSLRKKILIIISYYFPVKLIHIMKRIKG